MNDYSTLKDVASQLRVKPYRINYALSTHLVPEPPPRSRPNDHNNPYRFAGLNWRQLAARQLFSEADDALPSHDDPWINDLARLYYLGRLRSKSPHLNARHLAIRAAAAPRDSGALAAEVLEARLLVGLSAAGIAAHSTIPLDVIEAYAALSST